MDRDPQSRLHGHHAGHRLENNRDSQRNERIEKPVFHLSISWAPEDVPTRDQVIAVADQLRIDLSLKDHQAVFVAYVTVTFILSDMLSQNP